MRARDGSRIQGVLDSLFEMSHVSLVLAVFLAIAIACTVFSPLFELNEMQAMYFLSSIPQVIAGFVGLTIAGYAIVAEGLRRLAQRDESTKGVIDDIQMRFRMLLLKIIFVGALGSVACFLGIVGFPDRGCSGCWVYDFLLNISGSSLLASLYLIGVLVWNVSNPNLIQKTSNEEAEKMTKQLEKDLEKEPPCNQDKKVDDLADDELRHDAYGEDNLARFLNIFNHLDNCLVEFAAEAGYDKAKGRAGIMSAVRYLMGRGYLSESVYQDLLEVIRYRNYLVHGTDLQVGDEWIKRLNGIYLQVFGLIHSKSDLDVDG